MHARSPAPPTHPVAPHPLPPSLPLSLLPSNAQLQGRIDELEGSLQASQSLLFLKEEDVLKLDATVHQLKGLVANLKADRATLRGKLQRRGDESEQWERVARLQQSDGVRNLAVSMVRSAIDRGRTKAVERGLATNLQKRVRRQSMAAASLYKTQISQLSHELEATKEEMELDR